MGNANNEQWAAYESEGKTFVSVGGEDIFPICEVFPHKGDQNSRLIAAAPELYALAERIARLNKNAGEIGAGMLASLVDEANRIIAKVEK